jgi:hypothetical protein
MGTETKKAGIATSRKTKKPPSKKTPKRALTSNSRANSKLAISSKPKTAFIKSSAKSSLPSREEEILNSKLVSKNVAKLLELAKDVFGNKTKMQRWMRTANQALAGSRPVSLLNTPKGVKQVEEVLLRIEYGIYS